MQRQTRRAGPRRPDPDWNLRSAGDCRRSDHRSVAPGAERAHADAVAEELSLELIGSLRYAKNEAAARSHGVRLSFYESRAGGCYLVHTGDRSDCRCTGSDSAQCGNGAEAMQAVFLPADEPVQLTANVSSMLFNAPSATSVSGGALCIVPSSGKEIRHVVDIEGSVRSCAVISHVDVCEPC